MLPAMAMKPVCAIVWLLLGLHTAIAAAELFAATVLAELFHSGPLEGRRFVDVRERALHWRFIAWATVPVYATLYWGGRTL